MSNLRTVIPHKVVGQEVEEATLAAETLPGKLVCLTGTGANYDFTATVNGVRGGSCFIVYEDENFGKNCRQAIPSGSRAQCYMLQKGMRVTPHVKAGVAIAAGDYLVPDTDGLVDKAAAAVNAVQAAETPFAVSTFPAKAEVATAPQLLQALEACTDAATGDARRILCRVIR